MREPADLTADLTDRLPRLHRAVTAASQETPAGFVTGGQPSWELVNTAVLALCQDIVKQAAWFEEGLRALLGLHYRPPAGETEALSSLLVAVEETARRGVGAHTRQGAASYLGRWLRRAEILLGDAFTPWQPTWPDGTKVTCPVIDPADEQRCGGQLWVYRDDDPHAPLTDDERTKLERAGRTLPVNPHYGMLSDIRCARRASHVWFSRGGGWMTLGALLQQETGDAA